jgi:hypothetical protein
LLREEGSRRRENGKADGCPDDGEVRAAPSGGRWMDRQSESAGTRFFHDAASDSRLPRREYNSGDNFDLIKARCLKKTAI